MDLRKLKYFAKVADTGGFRRASEALNIAQPALTRQIQALEADLGVPLLFRSASGVTPTAQGEILLEEIRIILSRIEGLRSRVTPKSGEAKGEVRLGLPPALADIFFGTLIERVRSKHPDVHIICREGAGGLAESIENGSLDLAIVSIASKRANYKCRIEYLLKEQDYIITSKRILPEKPFVTIDEMLSRPLVLTPMPNDRRRNLERLARERGVKLNVIAEAATMSAQINLVLRELGSAVLPYSAAQLMKKEQRVALIPVEKLQSRRALLVNNGVINATATEVVAREIRKIFEKNDSLRPAFSDASGLM